MKKIYDIWYMIYDVIYDMIWHAYTHTLILQVYLLGDLQIQQATKKPGDTKGKLHTKKMPAREPENHHFSRKKNKVIGNIIIFVSLTYINMSIWTVTIWLFNIAMENGP